MATDRTAVKINLENTCRFPRPYPNPMRAICLMHLENSWFVCEIDLGNQSADYSVTIFTSSSEDILPVISNVTLFLLSLTNEEGIQMTCKEFKTVTLSTKDNGCGVAAIKKAIKIAQAGPGVRVDDPDDEIRDIGKFKRELAERLVIGASWEYN